MASIICKHCSEWNLVDGKWVRTVETHQTVAAIKACHMKAERAKAALEELLHEDKAYREIGEQLVDQQEIEKAEHNAILSVPPATFDPAYAGETWDDGANDFEVF